MDRTDGGRLKLDMHVFKIRFMRMIKGGHWGFAESGKGLFWVRKSIIVSAECG